MEVVSQPSKYQYVYPDIDGQLHLPKGVKLPEQLIGRSLVGVTLDTDNEVVGWAENGPSIPDDVLDHLTAGKLQTAKE